MLPEISSGLDLQHEEKASDSRAPLPETTPSSSPSTPRGESYRGLEQYEAESSDFDEAESSDFYEGSEHELLEQLLEDEEHDEEDDYDTDDDEEDWAYEVEVDGVPQWGASVASSDSQSSKKAKQKDKIPYSVLALDPGNKLELAHSIRLQRAIKPSTFHGIIFHKDLAERLKNSVRSNADDSANHFEAAGSRRAREKKGGPKATVTGKEAMFIPCPPHLRATTEGLTFECWINPHDTTKSLKQNSSHNTCLLKHGDNAKYLAINLYNNMKGGISVMRINISVSQIGNPTTNLSGSGSGIPVDFGRWLHLAVTYDKESNEYKVLINGAIQRLQDQSGNPHPRSAGPGFGSQNVQPIQGQCYT